MGELENFSKINNRGGTIIRYTRVDKGEQNRTAERNFRPGSVLNTFSKIYEKIFKKQLIQHLDKTLSIFIAAYRQAYGTQHLLIRLIEDWRSHLDNDFLVWCNSNGSLESFQLHPA